MVKHTQTLRRQQPRNCLSVSGHFVSLVLKRFKREFYDIQWYKRGIHRVYCKIKPMPLFNQVPENDYSFKVNKRNTRERCEICSKLTIKAPKQSHWRHSRVFGVNVADWVNADWVQANNAYDDTWNLKLKIWKNTLTKFCRKNNNWIPPTIEPQNRQPLIFANAKYNNF